MSGSEYRPSSDRDDNSSSVSTTLKGRQKRDLVPPGRQRQLSSAPSTSSSNVLPHGGNIPQRGALARRQRDLRRVVLSSPHLSAAQPNKKTLGVETEAMEEAEDENIPSNEDDTSIPGDDTRIPGDDTRIPSDGDTRIRGEKDRNSWYNENGEEGQEDENQEGEESREEDQGHDNGREREKDNSTDWGEPRETKARASQKRELRRKGVASKPRQQNTFVRRFLNTEELLVQIKLMDELQTKAEVVRAKRGSLNWMEKPEWKQAAMDLPVQLVKQTEALKDIRYSLIITRHRLADALANKDLWDRINNTEIPSQNDPEIMEQHQRMKEARDLLMGRLRGLLGVSEDQVKEAAELRKALKKITELERGLAKTEAQRDHLTRRLANATEIAKHNSGLTEQVQTLREEMNTARVLLSNEHTARETEYRMHSNVAAQLREQNETEANRCRDQHHSQMEEVRRDRDDIKEESRKAMSALERCETERDVARKDLDAAKAWISNQRVEAEELKQKLSDLESESKRSENELVGLRGAALAGDEKNAAYLQTLQDRLEELQQESTATIQAQRLQITQAEEQEKSSRALLENATASKSQAERDMERMKDEHEGALDRCRKERETAIHQAEGNVAGLRNEHQRKLDELFAAKDREVKEWELAAKDLQSDLAASRTTTKELQRELESLEANDVELANSRIEEAAQAAAKIRELENSNERLRKEAKIAEEEARRKLLQIHKRHAAVEEGWKEREAEQFQAAGEVVVELVGEREWERRAERYRADAAEYRVQRLEALWERHARGKSIASQWKSYLAIPPNDFLAAVARTNETLEEEQGMETNEETNEDEAWEEMDTEEAENESTTEMDKWMLEGTMEEIIEKQRSMGM